MNFGATLNATMQESFEYQLRVQDMYPKCKKLSRFKECNLSKLKEHKCSDVFWIDSILHITKKSLSTGGKTTNSYYTYSLTEEGCDCGDQMDIVVNNSYFTSGYSQLLGSGNYNISSFRIKARMLIKILGNIEKNRYLLTPLIIEKTGYYLLDDN